ncbi:hypothetical protein D3C76_1112780 [compost metagenome]
MNIYIVEVTPVCDQQSTGTCSSENHSGKGVLRTIWLVKAMKCRADNVRFGSDSSVSSVDVGAFFGLIAREMSSDLGYQGQKTILGRRSQGGSGKAGAVVCFEKYRPVQVSRNHSVRFNIRDF